MPSVVGWRLVKEKHAQSAFSGEGARIFAGRWNSAGTRMVYCSESLALAALEILVHVQPAFIRDPFRAFRIAWDGALMATIDLKKLGAGWNHQPAGAVSRKVGDDWIKAARFPVLAVPSAIVAVERTFLLNPLHPDFHKLKIEDAGRFALDPRLR